MENKKSSITGATPLLVVIVGPTASGKTKVAVELAKQLQTEILSFDSRQCYREMNIGTAKPTKEEQEGIPHYFIDSHTVKEHIDAALFADFGLSILVTLFKKHKVVLAVGGTGLYLKALVHGLDLIPEIPTEIRKKVRNLYQNEGLGGLQKTLLTLDSQSNSYGEWQNPHRLMRSLEVIWHSGYPIRHFHQKKFISRPFEVLMLGMDVPRTLLLQKIDQRTEAMMKTGLHHEAEELYPLRHINALQTVGYQELFNFFEKKYSLPAAVEQIKIHTRQYAKRQMTWFKKQKDIYWMTPDKLPEMLSLIMQRIQSLQVENHQNEDK